MSKELEALNKIAYSYGYDENIKIIAAALNDYEILKNDFISMRDFKYEQLDALDIIKEKRVYVRYLQLCENLRQYNNFVEMNWSCRKEAEYEAEYHNEILTQEEFDLLKKTLIK